MARISGSYPGGPKREGAPAGDVPGRKPRLTSVEQIEQRLGRASQARTRRKRTRRVWAGLVVLVAAAGGTGFFLGIRSHRSSEEITAGRNAPPPSQAFDPSFEMNRMLLELWKMEDDELHARQP